MTELQAVHTHPRIKLNTLELNGQRVFLTFGRGGYRRSVEVTVDYDYPAHRGVNTIMYAIATAYEHLPSTGPNGEGVTYIAMEDDQGGEQVFADINHHTNAWLSAILISAEIIDFAPAQYYDDAIDDEIIHAL